MKKQRSLTMSSTGESSPDCLKSGKTLLHSTSSSSSTNSQHLPSSSNNFSQYKIMLIGDPGVGKTSLFLRFHDQAFFNGHVIGTVGVDFREKLVTIGEKKVNLQVFDTAGQERFCSMTHSYIRDANAILLLYDITSYSSFENIIHWLQKINEVKSNDLQIMLIGNKVDKSQRVVSRQVGERLAEDFQISFLETSAKTGQNVELAFMATAQDLLDKEMPKKSVEHLDQRPIQIHSKHRLNESCC